MLLEIDPKHPDPRKIRQVAAALEAGELIAYPTDTVYGLGCDMLNKGALERLYQLKGMPKTQQLALICVDLSDIARYATLENTVYRTLRRLLPGAYTCILPATREVPKTIAAKRTQVGIRVPDAEIPRAIAREFGRPVISTTAGPPGGEPIQWPDEIARMYPRLSIVVDGGPGGIVPTTVLDFTSGEPVVVREGAGDFEEFLRD